MTESCVGNVGEFDDTVRKFVDIDGREVVVFRARNAFHAYENTCPHAGGPVGEGVVLGRVQAVLDDQKRLVREEFDDDAPQLVCPWHGWAFDLETGVCAGKATVGLRAYQVRVESDLVYVSR